MSQCLKKDLPHYAKTPINEMGLTDNVTCLTLMMIRFFTRPLILAKSSASCLPYVHTLYPKRHRVCLHVQYNADKVLTMQTIMRLHEIRKLFGLHPYIECVDQYFSINICIYDQ